MVSQLHMSPQRSAPEQKLKSLREMAPPSPHQLVDWRWEGVRLVSREQRETRTQEKGEGMRPRKSQRATKDQRPGAHGGLYGDS